MVKLAPDTTYYTKSATQTPAPLFMASQLTDLVDDRHHDGCQTVAENGRD